MSIAVNASTTPQNGTGVERSGRERATIDSPRPRRPRSRGATAANRWALGIGLWCLGCGPIAPPAPLQTADARQVLDEALAAWKRGATSASLTMRQPPVDVREPDWSAGAQLLDFRIDADATFVGNSCNLPARITIRRPSANRPESFDVKYVVSSGESVSVVRE